jgi:hypothetical protein
MLKHKFRACIEPSNKLRYKLYKITVVVITSYFDRLIIVLISQYSCLICSGQSMHQIREKIMTGFAMVQSRAVLGLDAPSVTVEVHLANGLPSFTLVGLAETEVKEARERVRSALQNSGLDFPSNKRITVNLAPADLPKDSGRQDAQRNR